eukprot:g2110.t1
MIHFSTVSKPIQQAAMRISPNVADHVWTGLRKAFENAYCEVSEPMPSPNLITKEKVRSIPDQGCGFDILPELWKEIVQDSVKLSNPLVMGHMDTAPLPAAALTDAIVSALNNNLLFREISPLASVVEEVLVTEFCNQLGLDKNSPGIFTSGGSISNLTALFAATGGFNPPSDLDRSDITVVMGKHGHASIGKACKILGLHIVHIDDEENGSGRVDVSKLEIVVKNKLDCRSATRNKKVIVVGVLGGTVNGYVDDLISLSNFCERMGDRCWFHVDAIWGGALAYSKRDEYRKLLSGIEKSDSISLGPQKWLFVPRLCALTLFPKFVGKNSNGFHECLAATMPYSYTKENENRGQFGLMGSRRADAIPLYVVMQTLGRIGLANYVDSSLLLTQQLYKIAMKRAKHSKPSEVAWIPTHYPMTNLLTFRCEKNVKKKEKEKIVLNMQQKLHCSKEIPWVSCTPGWDEDDGLLLRCVLANPALEMRHIVALMDKLYEDQEKED